MANNNHLAPKFSGGQVYYTSLIILSKSGPNRSSSSRENVKKTKFSVTVLALLRSRKKSRGPFQVHLYFCQIMSFQANIRYLICFGFGRWYRQLKGCIFTVWGRCYEDVGSLLWGCGDRYYNCLDIVGYGQCTDLKSPTGIRLNIMHSLPHIRWYIAKFKQVLCWLGPYHVEYTPSRLIWEVKQRRAWLVLAWVTGWEYHVFKPLKFFFT